MITTLTPKLRQYLVSNHGMQENASLSDAKALIGELVGSGKLTVERVKELAEFRPAEQIKKEVQEMVTKAVGDALANQGGTHQTQTKSQGGFSNLMATSIDNSNGGGDHIRVKDASERYLDVKSVAKHRRTGEVVHFDGSPVYTPSEKSLAKVGVWFKDFCRRNADTIGKHGLSVPALSEHEANLLAEMRAKGRWSGVLAGDREVVEQTLGEMFHKSGADDMTLKALLDDATSGGQYITPSEFDEAVVTYPLLYGELLPRVDLRTTNRNSVETAAFSNPTVAWGGSDKSITLFTTTSMITQIASTCYDVVAGIEMGRDFLADSPVEVGAVLTEIYGQVFAKELDDVIANGVDGSNQPEGILQATGTATVNSENGSTGPWTVTDLEALLFGIAKQYRTPGMGACFISNETTYQRIRGIEVGTTDQRRVLGMDHESYVTLGRPHLINEDFGNGEMAFAALKKYRLWRRAGTSIEAVSGGKTLALANTTLLIARARYAGQLLDANAAAICADGQS